MTEPQGSEGQREFERLLPEIAELIENIPVPPLRKAFHQMIAELKKARAAVLSEREEHASLLAVAEAKALHEWSELDREVSRLNRHISKQDEALRVAEERAEKAATRMTVAMDDQADTHAKLADSERRVKEAEAVIEAVGAWYVSLVDSDGTPEKVIVKREGDIVDAYRLYLRLAAEPKGQE